MPHYIENRPWGSFETLKKEPIKNQQQSDSNIKIITVQPEQKVSYQSHKLREEHWVFIQGRGKVILNDQEQSVQAGTYVYVPQGAKHRVINDGDIDLKFVEVTTGQFDENDIERFSDQYGRA